MSPKRAKGVDETPGGPSRAAPPHATVQVHAIEHVVKGLLHALPFRARLAVMRRLMPVVWPIHTRDRDEVIGRAIDDALDDLDDDDEINDIVIAWPQAEQEDLRDNVARYVAKIIEQWLESGSSAEAVDEAKGEMIEALLDDIRKDPVEWRKKNCVH